MTDGRKVRPLLSWRGRSDRNFLPELGSALQAEAAAGPDQAYDCLTIVRVFSEFPPSELWNACQRVLAAQGVPLGLETFHRWVDDASGRREFANVDGSGPETARLVVAHRTNLPYVSEHEAAAFAGGQAQFPGVQPCEQEMAFESQVSNAGDGVQAHGALISQVGRFLDSKGVKFLWHSTAFRPDDGWQSGYDALEEKTPELTALVQRAIARQFARSQQFPWSASPGGNGPDGAPAHHRGKPRGRRIVPGTLER